MGKFSFVVGAGLGYVLGTRAGRAQYERIKKATSVVWSSPRVQERVQKVETKVGDIARTQSAAMTDKIVAQVKDRILGGPSTPAGPTGTRTAGASGNGATTGAQTPPAEPIPPVS
ncbi:hypothetical protein GCM10009790_16830 [Georgenia ruanii]